MAIRYLYEFDYNNAPTQRLVEGTSLQTNTYTYTGVASIDESDHYLNVLDNSSNFPNFVMNRAVDKFLVTRLEYDTNTQLVDENSKVINLYSNVNADSKSVSLRLGAVPDEQLRDAQKLVADGIVQLYEIKLANGTYLHLKQDNSIRWNGYDWQGIPILFEGYSSAQGDSYARPTLSIANPDGVYSSSFLPQVVTDENDNIVAEYPYGLFDRAEVNRYLVLYDNIMSQNEPNWRPIYQKKTWIIWFVKTINNNMIQVELRNPMDGVNFDIPARMYIPPEFPFVTLK